MPPHFSRSPPHARRSADRRPDRQPIRCRRSGQEGQERRQEGSEERRQEEGHQGSQKGTVQGRSREIELKYLDKDKSFWVEAVAFGADGKTLAACYRPRTVVIWNLDTKKEAKIIKGPEVRGLGEFKSLLYINDQVFVGTGHSNKPKEKPKEKVAEKEKDKGKDKEKIKESPIRGGEIMTWDAKTGKPGKSFMGHDANIEALAVSKDGNSSPAPARTTLSRFGMSLPARTRRPSRGIPMRSPESAFSPDGKQIVTTSMDRTVRVWDLADAKEIASFKIERMVEKKDPKGKVTQVKELGRDFTRALFTNDGKKVLACERDGLIKFYDVEGKKEVQELKAGDGLLALALSPDGSKFATGGYDQTIKIWETSTGKELHTIEAHLGNVLTLNFSPDNQWLASGSTDGTVKIWSVK